MKKIATLVLALAALSVAALAQTHDTTAPALTAFSFTPSNPDAQAGPVAVSFTATVTDDLSGAEYISVSIVNAAGIALSNSTGLGGGTSATRTFAVTFPQYSAAGSWTIVQVVIRDVTGNTRTLTTSDLTAAGYATVMTVQ